MKKNIFTILAAFVFVICMSCFNVFGADVGDFSVSGDSGYVYKNNVLVITGSGSFEITMKDGVSSTSTDRIKIMSKEDVTVTINNLNISNTEASPFVIDSSGDVTLLLKGDNVFYTESSEGAALQKKSVYNMVIISSAEGDGSEAGTLRAEVINTSKGAGIGGSNTSLGENIEINGGTITAIGGYGAGVGGGYGAFGGYITINGGKVNASSNSGGSAIGSGQYNDGGYIAINDGVVNAVSISAAAIGGSGHGHDITITGGTVTAKNNTNGSAIGGGFSGIGKNITITGGTVNASSVSGPAIGGGSWSGTKNIAISGGFFNLSVSEDLPAIGGRGGKNLSESVTIEGGYFAEGDINEGTVYGIAVGENNSVEINSESSGTVYPYKVTGSVAASEAGTSVYRNTNIIQLTGYRYSNYTRLCNGYMLLNCYAGKDEVKKPSVVIKPDGTVAFKPGKYYIVSRIISSKDKDLPSTVYFPQSRLGNLIVVCDIDTDLYGIADMEGNLTVDCTYDYISPYFENYYIAYKKADNSNLYYILNGETGKVLYNYSYDYDGLVYFVSEDEKNMGVCKIYDTEKGEENRFVYAVFDYDGNILAEGDVADDENYSGNSAVLNLLHDKTGDTYYYMTGTIEYATYDTGGKVKYAYERKDTSETDNSVEFTIGSEYTGSLGGGYAILKTLENGEKEEDYRPKEASSDWAAESIENLTEEGILFNEDNCCYSDNISRMDFAYIASDVFSKAQYTDVYDYIKQNSIEIDKERFSDTTDPYAAFAAYIGIMEPTSSTTFSPARGISYDEAVTMFNNLADLLGVNINFTTADFTETDRPALSREQTYVCLCRIYEAAISQ